VTYRNDIDALSARHTALAAELEAKTRELDSTSRMLDEMKAKARLPVLPNIRVASPCTADWNAMTPIDAETERVRHCGSCEKNVYNLSQMTRDEAEALILAKEGRLCVRYFQRKDGTILLKDCTVGVANGRKRRLIAAGAAALLAGGAGAAFTLRADTEDLSARIIHDSDVDVIEGKLEVAHDDPPPPAPPEPPAAPTIDPDELHVVMGRMPIPRPELTEKMGDVSFEDDHDPLAEAK
jgi:hypothetical protein